ncbi:hypothetical protein EHI44_30555 [Rhizobium leguminosarum]|nr:hypothetical protein EHI44_30555 [Rhizobium leguminosarum]
MNAVIQHQAELFFLIELAGPVFDESPEEIRSMIVIEIERPIPPGKLELRGAIGWTDGRRR